MQNYSLSHVESHVLLRDLTALVAQDRENTARLLAHIGEVKERKLYRQAGQPRMHAYCVNVLRFSEDAAAKRLQAAGVARRHPMIFDALAEGRLHLSGICLLAPHLMPENASELIAAAMHKTKAEIEKLIADRFPQADLPERLEAVSVPGTIALHQTSDLRSLGSEPNADTAPGQFFGSSSQSLAPATLSEGTVILAVGGSDAPATPSASVGVSPYARLKPLAPQRYGLQVTLDERAHDLLREAQDLLENSEGGRQISNVLTRALELLVSHLKHRRFAETQRPRRSSRKAKSARTIPARVKRAVSSRDQGQCTYLNDAGLRCPARSSLQYDHIQPVAKGGESTVTNLRLRCHAHNQLEAERAFGERFMQAKRAQAQGARDASDRSPGTPGAHGP